MSSVDYYHVVWSSQPRRLWTSYCFNACNRRTQKYCNVVQRGLLARYQKIKHIMCCLCMRTTMLSNTCKSDTSTGTSMKRKARDTKGQGSQACLQELNNFRIGAVENVYDCKHTELRDYICICSGMLKTRPPHLARAPNLRTTSSKFPKSSKNKRRTKAG